MNLSQRFKTTALVSAILLMSACAYLPKASNDGSDATATNTDGAIKPQAHTGVRLADDKSNRYLRLDAANTGIQTVADDGLNTFAVFASEPTKVEVFNEDGKPVRSAHSKNVLAVEGKHQGLLFRTLAGTSFAAPNPRAPTSPLEAMTSDPDVADARSMLEGEGSQKAAYQRALALAAAKAAATSIVKVPSAEQGAAAPTAASTPIVVTAPAPVVVSDDATYVRQANGVLMRVFFASGGRSIVRPDDGLSRLAKEAQTAQQVRITGFTDNLGKPAWNSTLAQQRAEAIRNHLVKSGIPAERIMVSWTGATDFLAENNSDKGRAMNRRVEVQMIQPAMAAKN